MTTTQFITAGDLKRVRDVVARMRRVAVLALGVLCLGSPHAFADVTTEQVLSGLRAIKGAEVEFSELRETGFLTTGIVITGEISWAAPATLIKRTLSPFEETVSVDGDTVSIRRVDDGRVRGSTASLAEHPEIKSVVDSVRATLAGDSNALETLFSIESGGSIDAWTLVLTPREDYLKEKLDHIEVIGAEDRLKSFKVIEADGDASDMTLSYTKVW